MPRRVAQGIEAIREAARARAEASSLRSAAEEIGLSYTGFRAFLQGGKPHPETRQRLVAWFTRQQGVRANPPARTEHHLGVELVLAYLQESPTPKVLRQRATAIAQALGQGMTDGERSVVVPAIASTLLDSIKK